MKFDDLTAKQCDDLREQLGPHRLYLRQLLERMHKRGWSESDGIFQLAKQAADATDRMWLDLHYRAGELNRAAWNAEKYPPRS